MPNTNEPSRIARIVHRTLLTGLTASVLLLSLGWILSLARNEPGLKSAGTGAVHVIGLAASGDGPSLLKLGLVALMLTPVLRVFVLAIGWLIDRDWTFSLIAGSVLALLTLSVVLGTG